MRIITPRDVDPGAGRRGPRQPARPAPAALGVPPHVARARSALRARRHPARAAPQRVGVRPARQPVTNNYAEKRNEPPVGQARRYQLVARRQRGGWYREEFVSMGVRVLNVTLLFWSTGPGNLGNPCERMHATAL